MENEKLKIWLNFSKFLLGTFALGLVTAFLSNDIKMKEIELKEQNQIGSFLEHALQEDVGVRYRFSQYFSKVTRSKELRERWEEYYKIVKTEYDEKLIEKTKLQEKGEKEPLKIHEEDKLYQLKQELSPRSAAIVDWFAVLASYNEKQLKEAQKHAHKISDELKKKGSNLKVEIYKTKISRNFAVTVGGRLSREEALRLAKISRESPWGAHDAFAQKDIDWLLIETIDYE